MASFVGNYIEIDEVRKLLDSLRLITVRDIKGIIEKHPNKWLPDTMKNEIISWWSSDARLRRIDGIEKGIEDGSYL